MNPDQQCLDARITDRIQECSAHTGSARLALLTLLFMLMACGLGCSMDAVAEGNDAGTSSTTTVSRANEAKTIRVGVRPDALPFSYMVNQGTIGENVTRWSTRLEDYQGFMVNICREVLREVIREGDFRGARIEAVPVFAKNRFIVLDTGNVDMLCGPDSITTSRLSDYRVSHPLFLSGVSFAYVRPDSGRFPRKRYCSSVIGVVEGTTAASIGLEQLSRENSLLRFDAVLDQFLSRSRGGFDPGFDPASFHTEECPDGHDDAPVRFFDNHQEGIDALCKGKVLYYVGDIDILRNYVSSAIDCPVTIDRLTRTREVYAAFFLKVNSRNTAPGIDSFDSLLLYSMFNNALLRRLQGENNILERQFANAFIGQKQSKDLAEFFDNMKVASDY